MWRQKVTFICLLVLVSSEKQEYEEKSRRGRLFTFKTREEEIRVELEFSIPFLTIPAKKTVDSFQGMWTGVPTININPATLAVGGAIVLGTTILLPFALKSYAHHQSHHGYSRLLENAEFSTDSVLEFASQMLSNGKTVRGCALRVACWTAQTSKTDYVRALQEITSNSLLTAVINSTAVEDAMISGRKGRDCTTYTPCPLREEHIPILFRNLASITNSLG